jgi:hypothetical protein
MNMKRVFRIKPIKEGRTEGRNKFREGTLKATVVALVTLGMMVESVMEQTMVILLTATVVLLTARTTVVTS